MGNLIDIGFSVSTIPSTDSSHRPRHLFANQDIIDGDTRSFQRPCRLFKNKQLIPKTKTFTESLNALRDSGMRNNPPIKKKCWDLTTPFSPLCSRTRRFSISTAARDQPRALTLAEEITLQKSRFRDTKTASREPSARISSFYFDKRLVWGRCQDGMAIVRCIHWGLFQHAYESSKTHKTQSSVRLDYNLQEIFILKLKSCFLLVYVLT
jgi:hypothetical protein